MQAEYLLFNLAILFFPLILSFDRKVSFYRKWMYVFPSILIGSLPFLIWDYFAAGRLWWFNSVFLLNRLNGALPAEEILFFITVPYAVIFTWEVFLAYFKNNHIESRPVLWFLSGAGAGIGVVLLILTPMIYTGLVFLALSAACLSELLLRCPLWSNSLWYPFAVLVVLMIMIANGYLTARPVVEYNPAHMANLRIFTIPFEDFFFGLSHVSFTLSIYSVLKSRRRRNA